MDLLQLENELREGCPQMFTHPDLMQGEIWIGDYIIDVVGLQAGLYRSHGIPSTRVGTKPVMGKLKQFPNEEFEFRSVFMNLREFLIANEKYKQEQKYKEVKQ